MARAQLKGIGSITIWMIIFVALWLTSTVFLVILYTGQEELVSENNDLRKRNDRLISRDQDSSLELIRNARPHSEGGPTVVGLLEQHRGDTALLATGERADDASSVRSKRDQLLDSIGVDAIVSEPDSYEDASFSSALSMLYEEFKSEHAQRAAMEERLTELDAQVATLVDRNMEQKNDFDKRAKELSDELASVRADHDSYRTERESAIADLQKEFDDRREQGTADLTRERERRASTEHNLTELQARFKAQQERFGELLVGPEELATAREPDGSVLTAIAGDDVVYIDLGREDGITLGLQFSVYSASTGIPVDGRSKAQIEVVSINESSAECRIARVATNAVIIEGDLVANPVYDPNRQLTFVVIGRFDFDHDGAGDPDGAAVVDAIVTDWGGVVASELTALTDFVVVGEPPQRPRAGRDASREPTEQRSSIQEEWDRYNGTVATAKSLSVPILTQEVFLSFLGRTARR